MSYGLAAVLYEEGSFGIFLLVSVLMGGGGAVLSGRALAGTWRSPWLLPAYMLLLAAVIRFIHFALFGGTLMSAHYYAVDALVCLVFGWLGFRMTRAAQMRRQYPWVGAPPRP
jgi:hypothetical protein